MVKVLKTKIEVEGRVHEEVVVIDGELPAPWDSKAELTIVGQPVPRVDGAERVTGQARYTSDIQLPGLLHARILRSPHPHARVKSVDISAAEALPGVRAVICHTNTAPIKWYRSSFLFDSTLRHVGDEIAAVAADSLEIASDALRLIKVEYEVLPHITDEQQANDEAAPPVWVDEPRNVIGGEPDIYKRGDVDKAFKDADFVVQATFRTPTALHNCLETHGSVAQWEGDNLTIWDSTQHIFGVRQRVAEKLGLALNKVRVIKHYMGGGFGSKGGAGKYTVIAALLARKAGRPVKLMLNRTEENLVTGNRDSTVQHIAGAVNKDGTLLALKLVGYANSGAYGGGGMPIAGPVQEMYRCANVYTESWSLYTNLGRHSAFRAPGFVEGNFALESLMDMMAEKVKLDPLDFRKKNYAERDPKANLPYSSKGLRQAYERGAEIIGWHSRAWADRPAVDATHPDLRRGFGMASQIWGGGGGPPAHAIIKVNADGTADVITGTQDIGTGTKTVLSQVAAEAMGFRLEDVRVHVGDTSLGVYAPLSAGSMTVPSMSPAVQMAALDVHKQILAIAAEVLGARASSLELKGSVITQRKGKKRITVKELMHGLSNYMVVGRGVRGPNDNSYAVNTFGCQFAEVEVDTATGQVRVLRLVAVHESGRVINPMTITSQLYGGVTQGMGYGLMEHRVVDHRSGIVLNPNLTDYKIPTALDVPLEIVGEMIDLPDTIATTTGAKGVGEPPIVPTAPAIANAIYDACGVRMFQAPISPDVLLDALLRRDQPTLVEQPARRELVPVSQLSDHEQEKGGDI